MSNSVIQHHKIDTGAGILAATGVAWGGNALQTIQIGRHTQKDPQQAVGKKGIVDYTSQPITTDLSLDCILTEQSVVASEATSVNLHGDTQMVIGTESYVLTSCNLGFQAGSPATVNYGYITAGMGQALATLGSDPTVLTQGEEAAFAVVMGSDGSGLILVAKNSAGADIILPSGIQSINFSASVNRDQIMDVRSSSPIQFVTTYPIDISVDLEMFNPNVDVAAMNSLQVQLAGLNNHADGAPGNPGSMSSILVKALGLTKVDESESVGVGGYLTYTYNYMGADMWIPLLVPTP